MSRIPSTKHLPRALALAAGLLLSGCQRQPDIIVYRIPKETNEVPADREPAPMASAPAAGATDAPTPPLEAPPSPAIHYDLPAGWQEKPLTPMRVASFRVPGSAPGQEGDASIVFLAGSAGGPLSNINRWRGQIGLAPVDEAALPGLVTHIQAHGHDFLLVDLAGTAPENAPKGESRMLAAMLSENNQSWFVKMTGPDAVVSAQRDAFIGLLQSLTISQ